MNAIRKTALTAWEGIWYVIGCIMLGAMYFQKVPAKKAMADFGLCELTGGEHFWYVVQCLMLGAGYFAKIPVAKALSELPQYRGVSQANDELDEIDEKAPLFRQTNDELDLLDRLDAKAPLFSIREQRLWAIAIVVVAVALAVFLTLHFTASTSTTSDANAAACHDATAIIAGKDIAAKLASDGANASDPSIRAGAALVGTNWNGGSGTIYFQGLTEVTKACQRLGLS